MLIMTIIVILSEIIYYSLFMYYSRKEGKFWKYIILFTLFSLLIILVGSKGFYTYLISSAFALLGMKYIVKIKVSILDLLLIITNILFKGLLEISVAVILNSVLNLNIILTASVFTFLKLLLVFLIRNKLSLIYNVIICKWNKSNVYIRYGGSLLPLIYIITSILTIIIYS